MLDLWCERGYLLPSYSILKWIYRKDKNVESLLYSSFKNSFLLFSKNNKQMTELGFNLYHGYPSTDSDTLFSGLDNES